MQSLICFCDLTKLWVAKIKRGWIKQRAFCRLFFAKEQRKALKGKRDGNSYLDFLAVH